MLNKYVGVFGAAIITASEPPRPGTEEEFLNE